MNKIKLAICMKDLEYQDRFVSCFINHYNHQYELHVFTSPEQMEDINLMEYAVIITGDYTAEEMAFFVKKGGKILRLEEDVKEAKNTLEENTVCAEKYQEVYRIEELIQRVVVDNFSAQGDVGGKIGCERIGIYSLTQEKYQAPFAALLGKIYGEQERVLVLDLQSYSGLREMEDTESSMGLEDLLSVAVTGNYSKSRMLECIHHEANWDYVCSVQNHQCLAEGSKEHYEALLELLVGELGYSIVIINFGAVFLGQLDMMEQCKRIYMLRGKDMGENWREKIFSNEVFRQEKENLLQKLLKIEIPQNITQEATWRRLVEKWEWGSIGEEIRQKIEKEKDYGTAMRKDS